MSFKSQLEYDLLRNLNRAEQSVRLNLHVTGLDEKARGHMERALNHLRESCVAINETSKARTVGELVAELERTDTLIETVRQRSHIKARPQHV